MDLFLQGKPGRGEAEGSFPGGCSVRLLFDPFQNRPMALPKQGDTVKVTLLNRETIEGVVEWVDGNGLWVKGAERSRWVPLEAFTAPHDSHPIDAKEEQSQA